MASLRALAKQSLRLVCLGALTLSFSACEFVKKREAATDPKPDVDDSGDQSAADPVVSLQISRIALSSVTMAVGDVAGVTVTVKNTEGKLWKELDGVTINVSLVGSVTPSSNGTFAAFTRVGEGVFSSTFTATSIGAPVAVLAKINDEPIKMNPPVIFVSTGPITKIIVEDAADGTGAAINAETLHDGEALTLYAVGRDAANRFVRLVSSSWSASSAVGTFTPATGGTTIFKPKKGSAAVTITADAPDAIVDDSTGMITMTWTPSDLAGLVMWLKADALYTAANNDAVASWTDVSGWGNNAAQAVAAERPLIKTSGLNSLPVLDFDGDDDSLVAVDQATLNSVELSLFAVAKRTQDTPYATIASKTTDASFTDGFLFGDFTGDGTTWGLFVNDASVSGAAANFATGSFKVLSAVYNRTNIRYFENGTLQDTVALTDDLVSSANDLFIGAQLEGQIAEILLYDSGLNDVDRDAIEDYLKAKYAL